MIAPHVVEIPRRLVPCDRDTFLSEPEMGQELDYVPDSRPALAGLGQVVPIRRRMEAVAPQTAEHTREQSGRVAVSHQVA